MNLLVMNGLTSPGGGVEMDHFGSQGLLEIEMVEVRFLFFIFSTKTSI
jgi:hypothetical protein